MARFLSNMHFFHKYEGKSLGETGAVVTLKLFEKPPNKIDR